VRRDLFIGLLLASATALVYGQVAGFDFTNFDDGSIIYQNPNVCGGLTLHGVLWALSTSYFDFWHPLTWWSHMLDCELFGLDPGSHHLMNLGFHVANTLLLFGVLRRMTGAWKRSALVAALFALHPLHVESVAWLSERKDVLSTFFFLLTLGAYVRYAQKQSRVEGRESSAGSGSLALDPLARRLVSAKQCEDGSEAETAQPSTKIYLSTGIHGDEPAGPLAALRLLQENQWPANVELWFCPCLNPIGFVLNRRENADGRDLNRDYRHLETTEVRAHIAWLQRQPQFDLCLCLHEDWESHGFYVYELNPENRPSLAEAMIARIAEICPIDPSEIIEDRPARGGIIRPNLDPHTRPQWAEAFYLIVNKTRLSYTLEAPSDFPLTTRVNSLIAGVNAALST